MGNIRNFNFNKLDLKLSNSDYWDFFLANDESSLSPNTGLMSGDCFVVWYDFNNVSIYPDSATTASTIYSLVSWSNAVNTGYTFNTIGLTGIDNGLVTFEKNPLDTSNDALVSALTGTTLDIFSGDTRLFLTLVTGTTGEYVYPTERLNDPTASVGDYMQFCGGFYQGYYKIDGSTYEVLPIRANQAWSAEFWLKPQNNCVGITGITLNDTYPDNKGFFFYMGARAENKFWNQFDGNNTGCTSACTTTSGCTDVVTEFCTVLKERDITIIGDYGFGIPLDPPQVEIELVTNPFLIYGRAHDDRTNTLTGETDTILLSSITNTSNSHYRICQGTSPYGYMLSSASSCYLSSNDGLGTQDVCSYDGNGIPVARFAEVTTDYTNPFLIYGRGGGYISGCSCSSCCGPNDGYGNKTICTYSGRTSLQGYIDYNLDIIDNALGFRIKDDGSIGYRLLTVTGECYTTDAGERLYTTGITIQEEYSEPNMVRPDEWSYVVLRFVTKYMDDCQLANSKPRTGELMFYVNGKLKFVVNNFPEFVARRLNEYKAKQVGVPFNFSLGGGSQGLIDSQTFDGLDADDRGLPIETNFAGSFIGGVSQFKFNICDLNYANIIYNYLIDAPRYGII